MKILVVGSTGTIGSAVVSALRAREHEVVGVARSTTPRVDLQDRRSIDALFALVEDVDAVVGCAGTAVFKPIDQLTDQDLVASTRDKLLGQVTLARVALRRVRDKGSITLTTGVLAQTPMTGGAAFSLVNAGVEGFARAAALEAPRGVRVNVVSPPWVAETLAAMKRDTSGGMPAAEVAKAYVAAVEGTMNGETLPATRFA
jgi:NAD(P)-dependent dehydrogenase (short-subunit alcohol dehydrogenase family)